jgi:leukotriene A-4 hydrolase/aminopeptidase
MKYTYTNSIRDTDPHSFAQPHEAVITHLLLILKVDFAAQQLNATATYQIKQEPNAHQIILDVNGPVIQGVYLEQEEPAIFKLGEEKPHLGQPLVIQLRPDTKQITIQYQTTANAAALQWLMPEQTAGKQHPFLFTQSQAILARTWLPCQDSPAIRFTYEAKVQVPTGFLALMSAENPQQMETEGVYSFKMPYPIPAYLMAMAVGNLSFQPIGPRTGVYAEPETLAAAAYEFAETEKMLVTAEKLYGTYPWGRYDLLVLPPSFPFGGMENPCLTFATPTIITGDRSLTSLIAHELAHSWSGNLVTNATWNDFWLNEGFTVYFERRIMEELYGSEYADMLKVLGYQDLQDTLSYLGRTNPDTCLKLHLQNRNPDEGLTEIAYEKGNLFLLTVEKAIGRARFDIFVNKYFADFKFQANTTENFLQYLITSLADVKAKMDTDVNPEAWLYEPDLPLTAIKVNSEKFNTLLASVALWQNNPNAALLQTENWSTHEWLYFLHIIEPTVTAKLMQELDHQFYFTQSENAEILAIWLQMALKTGYSFIDEALAAFLTHVGRRKFVLPLYKLLVATEAGKARARNIYENARPNYHAVTRQSVEALL